MFGRALTHPKEFGVSNYNEDAFCGEGEGTWFAVSDGVGSALFSEIWSEELCQAACEFQSAPQDESFAEVLQTARQRWHGRIEWDSLDYFRKKKFARHGGSFATLLYAHVIAPQESDCGETMVRLWCYGDCNAFHISNQECVQCWPYSNSNDFGPAPPSLCSTPIAAPDPESWHSTELHCNPKDRLLLATDALAEYLVGELERGKAVDWSRFIGISDEEYGAWIEQLRDSKQIERDDTTFLLISPQSSSCRKNYPDQLAVGKTTPMATHGFIVSSPPHRARRRPTGKRCPPGTRCRNVPSPGTERLRVPMYLPLVSRMVKKVSRRSKSISN